MNISSRGRYALRMFIDLAKHKDQGFIALKDIAERQGISKKYLEQIILIINHSNALKAYRGTHGGYKLARDPSNYTIAEILKLTEGSLSSMDLLNDDGSSGPDKDVVSDVCQELYQKINTYLESITLQDLIERERTLCGDDYVI